MLIVVLQIYAFFATHHAYRKEKSNESIQGMSLSCQYDVIMMSLLCRYYKLRRMEGQ